MRDDTPHNPPSRPLNPDDPKYQWQQEQLARDAAAEKQKIKDERARERRSRSALRKLQKAKADLEKLGEITEWEEEFAGSVEERLEKFGSAFVDPMKGAPSDALSRLQKQVLSQMRKKARDKGRQSPDSDNKDADSKGGGNKYEKRGGFKPRSSFKNKTGFTPRVRQIEDEMFDEEPPTPPPIKGRPVFRVIKGGKD